MNLSDGWREAIGKKAVSGKPTFPLCLLICQDCIITDLHPISMEGRTGQLYTGGRDVAIFCRRMTLNSSHVIAEMFFLRLFSGCDDLRPRNGWSPPHDRTCRDSSATEVPVLVSPCRSCLLGPSSEGAVLHIQKFHVPIPGAVGPAFFPRDAQLYKAWPLFLDNNNIKTGQ